MSHPINPQIGISKVEKALAGWPTGGRHLLTLLDMIEFQARDYASRYGFLMERLKESRERKDRDRLSILDRPFLISLKSILQSDHPGLLHFCNLFGMDESANRISDLDLILDEKNPPSYEMVHRELWNLHGSLAAEMKGRTFLFVPLSLAGLVDNAEILGQEATGRFPRAAEELKHAGNCISLGLNGAAAFHLMRVMEHGLGALHKRLLKKAPANPNWKNVIEAVDSAIRQCDKSQQKPKGWRKDKSFYVGAASHFFYFKDKRNRFVHISLGIEEYPPPSDEQAIELLNQVKSFMQHLATKLKE